MRRLQNGKASQYRYLVRVGRCPVTRSDGGKGIAHDAGEQMASWRTCKGAVSISSAA
jgi:hypothetical protein